jgi:hypothetical protein
VRGSWRRKSVKSQELAFVLCEVLGMPTGRREEEEEEIEEGSLSTA